MTDSEREWAKKNKLKKTNLECYSGINAGRRGSWRNVYRATGGGKYHGELFYLERGVWHNIPEEYCREIG